MQYVVYIHYIPVLTPAALLNSFCILAQFYTLLCLPFQKPFESSIFSKISCLLGEQDKHYSETSILVVRFVLSITETQSEKEREGERERVLISSELPGVIPLYCMCPDPETSRIPMPPRRLALKTQPLSLQAHAHSFPPGDCG